MMGGNEQATIIGYHRKKDVSSAALINGSASHALDYDDTLVSFLGHPSVTIFPALLALSEWRGKSGQGLPHRLPHRPAGRRHRGCMREPRPLHGRMARHLDFGAPRFCSSVLAPAWPFREADRLCPGHRRHPGLGTQAGVRDHVQAIPCRQGFPVRAHGGPSGRAGVYQRRGHPGRAPGFLRGPEGQGERRYRWLCWVWDGTCRTSRRNTMRPAMPPIHLLRRR
ncbi:MAG: MmgE/PrpD family protein [Desulfobacterales bacterium]|nr:MmgE/PrpD family protein [Desulfobacterales bacterium]